MASFKVVNILFFSFLIYFKFARSGNGFLELLPSPRDPVYFSIKGIASTFNANGSRILLRFNNSEWMFIYSGDGEGKSVNVQYKKDSDKYICGRNGKVYTYVTRGLGLFNKVRSQAEDGIEHVLFETRDILSAVHEVIYDERDEYKLLVTMKHVNGLTSKFTKVPGSTWVESLDTDSNTTLSQENVEIRVERKACEPGVKIEKGDGYFMYNFERGTKCLDVKYDGKQIMSRHSTDSPDKFPRSVLFSTKENKSIFIFNESMDVFSLDGSEWKSVFSGKPIQRSLNVLYKGTCEHYDCFGANGLYSYTPKGNRLFNKVRSARVNEDGEVIFETKDILEMAYEVAYDESDANDFIVHIHHVNGSTTALTRPKSGGKWKEYVPPPAGIVKTSPEAKPVTSPQGNLGGSASTSEAKTETQALEPRQSLPLLDQSKIKILGQVLNVSNEIVECDSSMYTTQIRDGVVVTYKMNDGIKCTSVKYDGKEVWKYDSSKPRVYPKRLHFLLSGPIVVEMNNGPCFFSVRRNDGDFESVYVDELGFKTDDVEIMTTDSKLSPLFVDRKNYRIINHGSFVEYKILSDTRCEGLRIKSEVPWTYVREIYKEHPSSLYVFPNRIVALCGNRAFVKQYDMNKPNEIWVPREIIRPALAGFKFTKKCGYLFYEIDPRVKCTSVKYDGKDVWKHDPKSNSPYPQSIFFVSKGKTAFVNFKSLTNVFRFESGKWGLIYSGRGDSLELFLGSLLPSDISYKESDYVHTYTCNERPLISTLTAPSGTLEPDIIIWKAKLSDACANKIVYDEKDPKNKVVTIYQLNGLTREFKKISGQWRESPQTIPATALSQDKVEILVELRTPKPQAVSPLSPNKVAAAPKSGVSQPVSGRATGHRRAVSQAV